MWSLDAATGRVHWIYAPPVDFLSSLSVQGSDIPTNRGVAVAGGRVYLLTYDCRLLALDAHNGTLLWQAPVADPRLGYYETTAPAVWDGLVFVGGSGGDSGARLRGRLRRADWRARVAALDGPRPRTGLGSAAGPPRRRGRLDAADRRRQDWYT